MSNGKDRFAKQFTVKYSFIYADYALFVCKVNCLHGVFDKIIMSLMLRNAPMKFVRILITKLVECRNRYSIAKQNMTEIYIDLMYNLIY